MVFITADVMNVSSVTKYVFMLCRFCSGSTFARKIKTYLEKKMMFLHDF